MSYDSISYNGNILKLLNEKLVREYDFFLFNMSMVKRKTALLYLFFYVTANWATNLDVSL